MADEPLDYYLEWNPRFWEGPFEFGRARVGDDFAGWRVLEIGPRGGRMCRWFAERGARVVGGDRYREYLAGAAAEAASAPAGAISLVQLRGEALPFRDNTFDLVFTKSVFVYLDKRLALPEIVRVLKPGGCVWMVENMKSNPFAAVVRLARLLGGQRWVKNVDYLSAGAVASFAPAFSSFEHAEFHLLTPALHALPLPRRWLRALVARESDWLRRHPLPARYAWLTCIVGRK